MRRDSENFVFVNVFVEGTEMNTLEYLAVY